MVLRKKAAKPKEEEEELILATKQWKKTKAVPAGYKVVPPDGGYGWIVVVGCFIVTTMISIPTLVFGIILKDMIQYTGCTNAQASWTVSISLAVSQFIAPLGTICIHLFTCRYTAIAGGIIMSFGLFLSTFAKSIQYLYFTFGILTGIGMGFSRVPCLVVNSHYFRVRFGITAGILFAGFGCGRLVFSPLCQVALQEYGFQGTFILISGICLNVCVGAALFRPVQPYLKLKKDPVQTAIIVKPTIIKPVQQNPQTTIENATKTEVHDEKVWISMSEEEKKTFLRTPEQREQMTGDKIANYMASALSIESIHQVVNIPPQDMKKLQATPLPPTPPHGRIAVFKKLLSSSLDFSLFKDPLFYLICFSGILTYLTILYSNVFLFPLAVEQGISLLDASLVVTAKATAEIIGRLAFPWIQKFTPIDPVLFYIIICILVGFSLLAQAMVTSFGAIIAFAILTGAVTGGTVVQNTTVTLNIVGVQRYPSVLGLCSFVQSFFALLAGPFIGFIRDITGSFVACYLVIMGIQFFAGLLWFGRYLYVYCTTSCIHKQ
ncbi:hypothetical protein CHUAL_009950 [Chamberlinius hualienensis]